ncbi:DNA helicase II [Teredinibacter waterburyi]|jgi:ATP-dependent DNA helicase UvrD (EC 3.6.1.-)|uniref:DNA helicase II n=1 Tax=Teredinibacter waterburyi TaxID=1500538 RepID=UPI00165EE5A7|nr:DNA helicase II [Teredinibacter waterburyi]
MNDHRLLNNLNEAQREAVSAPPANQLVLAGAGSGKTRVLVHRIAWLMQEESYSPNQIMAVTFTNKAAKEMKERLHQLLGDTLGEGRLRTMWVGTFHGIAHRLLKAHWQEAGLPQNFQILDGDDQLRLVKRVYQALNIDDSRYPAKQAMWFIGSEKDEGRRAQHIDAGHDPFLITMKSIYHAYEEACERGGMVDFAELLLRSHELWLKNPTLLKHYQQRFKALLVDEFQDTNSVQYAWLRVLAGKEAHITAVGDDDQSIYGWRGAKIENIQAFETDFAPVAVTRLEQNYRSTATILNAANAVIENNTDRLGKSLWTSDGDGEKIDLYTAFNEQDEARYIVDSITSWVSANKANNSDCAILYRSNAQSRVLEEAFIREDMPYRIYGGQRFYERLEIKNAVAYLRLLSNRNDDASFERVINTPTRGIGSKTIETLRLFAREQGCSLFDAMRGAISKGVFTARASTALRGFDALLSELQDTIIGLSLDAAIERVINQSGLLEFHKKEKGEKGQARIENLEELVNAGRVFVADDEDLTPLQQFLDNAALNAGDTQADEFEDAVQMMTLHSAKGLEFPLVFLAGMEENLFPHKMSAEEPGRMSEERRLCYVGITRAMKKLVISFAESRRLHGTENFNSVSRFVREIPKDLMQEVRIKSTITRPASYGGQPGGFGSRSIVSAAETRVRQALGNQSLQSAYPNLALGQLVKHPVFGEGTILQFQGHGDSAQVSVNFGSEGSKWLVLRYAKLEPA